MKKIYCVKCQKKHTNPWGWTYRKWSDGVEGWGCRNKTFNYEFTKESIKEDRKKYFKSALQPYRDGEFSREFKEAYPDISKDMVKEGVITRKQHDRARDVWKDLPGYNNRRKSL